jgi:hypothetical protein
MPDNLLNASEVPDLLGVTRRYVNRLASETEGFPEPAAVFPVVAGSGDAARSSDGPRGTAESFARADGSALPTAPAGE